MNEQESIRRIFATNLKRLFAEKELQRNALADYVGVSDNTVSSWVNGHKIPRMDKIDKICRFFGVNRSDLLELPVVLHADAVRNIVRNDTPPSAEAEKLRFVALLRGLQSNINALIESTIAEAMQSGETTAERNRRIEKESTQSGAG